MSARMPKMHLNWAQASICPNFCVRPDGLNFGHVRRVQNKFFCHLCLSYTSKNKTYTDVQKRHKWQKNDFGPVSRCLAAPDHNLILKSKRNSALRWGRGARQVSRAQNSVHPTKPGLGVF